jgi:hypothetical protein
MDGVINFTFWYNELCLINCMLVRNHILLFTLWSFIVVWGDLVKVIKKRKTLLNNYLPIKI